MLDRSLLHIKVHVTHGAGHDHTVGAMGSGIGEYFVSQIEHSFFAAHGHARAAALGFEIPVDGLA